MTITVNTNPVMTNISSKTICSGTTVNIGLTSDVAANYSWFASSNANVTGESTTAQTGSTINNALTNVSTTNQTVTYTVTPTSATGSCVGTPQTVIVNLIPSVTMTSVTSKTICSGSSVNLALTSNVASSYSWIATSNSSVTGESLTTQTTATIGDILTATTSQNVIYSVTPTSTAGSCPGSAQTVTVSVVPTPVMNSTATKTICSGSSVSLALTSNVASSYSWSAADNANVSGESTTNQTTSTISDVLTNNSTSNQIITYTVTPTSTSGSCVGTPQTVTITITPIPTMSSASSKTICSGSSVNLPLTSNVSSSYSWIAADNTSITGESLTNQTGNTINNTLTNISATNQNVVYTVTPTSTAGSCVGTSQAIIVTVNPTTTPTFTQAGPYCSGATIPALPTTSNNGITGTWSPAINNAATTTYTFTPSAGQCATTATMTVSITSTTANVALNKPATASSTYSPNPTSKAFDGINDVLNGNAWTASAYTGWIQVDLQGSFPVNTIKLYVSQSPNGNTTHQIYSAPSISGPWTLVETLSGYTSSGQVLVRDYSAAPLLNVGAIKVQTTSSPSWVSWGEIEVYSNSVSANVTASGPLSICQGNSVTLTANSGTGYTYQWKKDGVNISLATASTYVASAAGSYTVQVTNSSGCNALSTASVVTVSTPPTISVNSATICSGASATLTAIPSPSGGTYLWSTGATTSSITVSPTSSTNYTVSYTLGSCPASTATGTVTVNPVPTVSVNSATICSGATATLTATPSTSGGTYAWSTGATTQTITASSAGTYTVTYTLGTCSSTSATATVSNYTDANVALNKPATASGTYSTSTPPKAFDGLTTTGWSTPSNTGWIQVDLQGQFSVNKITLLVDQTPNGSTTHQIYSAPSISGPWTLVETITGVTSMGQLLTRNYQSSPLLNVGAIKVQTTSSPSWVSWREIEVYSSGVQANITASGPLTFCDGNSVTLTANSGTGNTYQWKKDGVNISSTSSSYTATTSGSYTVEVTNSNGCSATSTASVVSVTPTTNPTFTQVSPICSGATLSALPTTSNNGITGTWLPAINNTATTTYTFTPTAGQCASTASMTIAVNPNVNPTFNAVASICSGASLSALPTTSNNGITGTWSPALNNTATTTYTFTPTAGQCASTAMMTITVNPSPTLTVNDETICSGNSATLVATPTESGGTYLWSTGETTSSITVSPMNSITYTVTYSLGTCSAVSATATVIVNETPEIWLENQVICSGQSVLLNVASAYKFGLGNYLWSTGETTRLYTVSPSSTTSYTVQFTINGCPSLPVTATVVVLSSPTATIDTTIICSGQTVVTANVSPSSDYNYTWTYPATATDPGNVASFSATEAGTYSVEATPTGIVFAGISPSSITGTYNFTWAKPFNNDWATPDFTAVGTQTQGTLMLVEDGTPGTNAQGHPISQEGCQPLVNDLSGKIAVIYRNTCSFTTKALNAQNAGAIGVVIINRDATPIEIGGGTDGLNVSIPVIMINSTDGATLVNAMANGPVQVYLGNHLGNQENQNPVSCSNATATETISVSPAASSTTDLTICESELPYSWNGLTFNAAGSQTATLYTASGCDSLATLNLIVNPTVTPEFTQVAPICSGASLSALPTTSTNGKTGIWSPALNNTATTTYTFTPTAGQCASTATMSITVNPNITPTFTQVGPYLSGASIPALPTTSTNGISGTWSPAISNTATTTYTFTPSAGQCGTTTTMSITINQPLQYTLTANDSTVCAGTTVTLSVNIQPSYPAGTIHCNGTPTAVVDVTNPITGKTWMDRNLGASQVATSSTDAAAYGDLYQWGRAADGHQCRNSATTTTLSSTDQPGHGSFILAPNSPWDWRSPQNTNLWQGVNGVNNPCPSGYRLATEVEINNEKSSWSIQSSVGAFNSPLKFLMGGLRNYSDGSLASLGSHGFYWTSTTTGQVQRTLDFNNNGVYFGNNARARGGAVRCIKN
jgi:uncharacterized protein (TIGR02145 family)